MHESRMRRQQPRHREGATAGGWLLGRVRGSLQTLSGDTSLTSPAYMAGSMFHVTHSNLPPWSDNPLVPSLNTTRLHAASALCRVWYKSRQQLMTASMVRVQVVYNQSDPRECQP
jgi:hypothetical protein